MLKNLESELRCQQPSFHQTPYKIKIAFKHPSIYAIFLPNFLESSTVKIETLPCGLVCIASPNKFGIRGLNSRISEWGLWGFTSTTDDNMKTTEYVVLGNAGDAIDAVRNGSRSEE